MEEFLWNNTRQSAINDREEKWTDVQEAIVRRCII